ncbi:hypothetical protein LSTR_LSTR000595 [Laodelphax striatellus]|uniref:F-box domain-containing protein n=1 Tax=Laodelphax striatellus TaxID=195883 RepID=A0A482XFT8_LAOST|nr:hypothetical protein LSTR_LSTR000595 [Laodelphax striatellus]
MQTLPPEVFIGLLEYLPYRDRKSLSETSTYFNRLCLDRKYLEEEQIVFEDCVLSPENSPLNVFLKSERIFLNLKCINIEINSKSDIFWRKFAPFIKSLSLRKCSISLNYVTCFFSYMESLENLELDECRDLFMSGTIFSKPDDLIIVSEALHNVRKLLVNEQHYLSDTLFNRLVISMPNLNSLSLIGCYINFHEAVYRRYYNKDNLGSGSDSVLTFTFILFYLRKASSSLKKLDFSLTKLDDSGLRKIASLNGLNLTEICLHGCSELTNGSIIDLVNSQKNLMVLDIGGCVRLTDKALIAISDSLQKLRELNFSGCSGITNMGVGSLCKLTKLNKLIMMSCSEGSSSGIVEAICSPASNTIKFLDLRSLNFNDTILINLSAHLSNLVYLDLGLCLNAVSNLSLHAIFGNLRRLQHLKLRGCRKISDYGLCGIDENETVDPKNVISSTVKNEDEVQTHLCSSITQDYGQYNALTRNCSLANLKGLKTLGLSYCYNITDITLKYGIRFLELRDLDLSYCEKITDDGLRMLSKNNPSIEVLDLSGCKNLSDEGLTQSIQNLHRLRRLSLKGVNQLSVNGLRTIKSKCKALRYLNVSQCDLNLEEVDLGSLLSLRVVSFN